MFFCKEGRQFKQFTAQAHTLGTTPLSGPFSHPDHVLMVLVVPMRICCTERRRKKVIKISSSPLLWNSNSSSCNNRENIDNNNNNSYKIYSEFSI